MASSVLTPITLLVGSDKNALQWNDRVRVLRRPIDAILLLLSPSQTDCSSPYHGPRTFSGYLS